MPIPSLVFSRRFFVALFVASLLPVFCSAALTWQTQQIKLTVKPSDKQAVGIFHFVNSGNAAITITSVQSSCGCTTAELTKQVYAPGESGEIKAIFTIGDRVGEQEKTVFVVTDDAQEKSVPLVLHVTIPELLRYAPRLLMWNVGDKPGEKAAVISANTNLKIANIEITAPVTSEVNSRIEAVEAGVSYQLFVHPASTTTVMNAPVAGIATFADGTTQPFKIYALVR